MNARAAQLASLEALPAAVLVVLDGEVAFANAQARRWLGPGEETPVGRPLAALLSPADLGRLARHLAAGPAAGPVRLQLVLGGRRRPVEVRAAPLPGTADGLLLTAWDEVGTQARSAVAELALVAQHTADLDGGAALLEASTPLFDALTWARGLVRVEDGAAEIVHLRVPHRMAALGHLAADFEGRRLPVIALPGVERALLQGRAIHVQGVESLVVRPGPLRDAARQLAAHGFDQAAFCPVRTEGQPPWVFMVMGRRIAAWDLVAVEFVAGQIGASLGLSALRASLLRRERLAVVGELAAELAERIHGSLAELHRLTGVLGGPGAPADELTRTLLGMLGEEVGRLERLGSDILGFARPPGPRFEAVALPQAAARAVAAARRAMPQVPAGAVELALPADLPRARADAALLDRALTNVLVNALQAIGPTGKVRLTARAPGDAIFLRVMNDGPPIPPEVAARLFEPFFTTRAAGTGLGLAVARRIMEDLGGRVDLEPSDTGTCFRFRLSVAR